MKKRPGMAHFLNSPNQINIKNVKLFEPWTFQTLNLKVPTLVWISFEFKVKIQAFVGLNILGPANVLFICRWRDRCLRWEVFPPNSLIETGKNIKTNMNSIDWTGACDKPGLWALFFHVEPESGDCYIGVELFDVGPSRVPADVCQQGKSFATYSTCPI